MKNRTSLPIYGFLNAANIGIIMKDMTRRVMSVIQKERLHFIATAKAGYDGELNDVATTADTAAQEVYTKLLKENFPGFGIIAEEDKLKIDCTFANGENFFFTVDPLDGTKAYVRKQSNGIGTMLALVHNGQVIAACVGDIMTNELFYFRPESPKTHRLGATGIPEELPIPMEGTSLTQRYALLRERERAYHPVIQRIVAPPEEGGLVQNIDMANGSIGISMSRLWKNEVGLAVMKGGYQTPWDWAPVVGISQHLGYKFFMTSTEETDNKIVQFDPVIPLQPIHFPNDIIVVHENYVGELLDFTQKLGFED